MTARKIVQFTLNGQRVEAAEGSLMIDAALEAGVEIPYYCYHPALGNPGNCRLCVVEVEGAGKPAVSCRLAVKEGMVVRSDSPAAKRAQAASLEFHLVNHPLDCPVCDQSGECGLQDYYMKVGRYESSVREDKEHKEKRIVAGPHVMLDQERCILCTRCTRFLDQVTGTHELGIFGRGHEEYIDVVPGKTLDNPYSGNVVDICPVGALTDRDFRYQVRVWYLDETDSICPGCSRGCSISVHTSTRRTWHNQGRRVARLKPRHNPDVNGYWICDEGRYGYLGLDTDRLGRVLALKPQPRELAWEAALDEIAAALERGVRGKGSEGLAVVASGALSNEDWGGLQSLFVSALGAGRFLFTPEPDQVGEEDALLRKREKVPNLEGGEARGFGTTIRSATFESLAADIEAGLVWGLYVVDRDPVKVWGERAPGLLERLDVVVYQGPWKGATGDLADFRLPATAYVEEEGHFTNFEGRVQAYRKALEPLGEAQPDWWIFRRLEERCQALAERGPVTAAAGR
jgi:NADH-quinone oxidoreductase subunit G